MMNGWKSLEDRDDTETLPLLTEEDTQECASFLLTLKHRSVTPDPNEEMQDLSPQLQAFRRGPPVDPLFLSEQPYDSDECDSLGKEPSLSEELDDDEAVSVETLIEQGGGLVALEDRDLVPDSLYVAMAQMRPCQLTEPDKVGCYKNREVGFIGFECRHCSGSPGFGRFFPATVRSLAQTTTSQTILKHVGSKCRFCPSRIRDTILDLQRQQAIKDESLKQTKGGRPRYGSRKVFFQRIWGRLHNEVIPERPLHNVQDDETIMSHVSDLDESSVGEHHHEEEVVVRRKKPKHRFGALPTKKNLKRKIDLESSPERETKRSRDYYLVD